MKEKPYYSITLYKGRILTLKKKFVYLPNQEIAMREIVEHQGGVGVLAINDNNEILLIEQYRAALEKPLLEIPAGLLEEGENPKQCARRELREETGYDAKNFRFLGKYYPSPGFSNEVIHLFLATELFYNPLEMDKDEFLKVKLLPVNEAIDFIYDLDPVDAKTAIAILRYFYQFNIKP